MATNDSPDEKPIGFLALLGAYVAVRLVLAVLCAFNGSFEYGELGQGWRESPDGYRFRLVESRVLDPLGRWDSTGYLSIASLGYFRSPQGGHSNAAFFPGYPWLVAALHRHVASHLLAPARTQTVDAWYNIGHGASTVCFLVFLFSFHRWARRRYGPVVARRAALLVIFAPTSFVFACVHSEALFMAAAMLAFSAAERNRWLTAGAMGAIVTVTRPFGILTLIPLAVLYLEQRGWGLARLGLRWLWLLLMPLALLAVFFIMAEALGNPLEYHIQQSEHFGHGSFPSLRGVAQLFATSGKTTVHVVRDVVQIVWTAAALGGLAVLVRVDRRLPLRWTYVTLVAVLLATALLSGALLSMPRYVSVLFPLYAGLAAAMPSARVFRVVAALLLAGQIALWLAWMHNQPVVI